MSARTQFHVMDASQNPRTLHLHRSCLNEPLQSLQRRVCGQRAVEPPDFRHNCAVPHGQRSIET